MFRVRQCQTDKPYWEGKTPGGALHAAQLVLNDKGGKVVVEEMRGYHWRFYKNLSTLDLSEVKRLRRKLGEVVE